MTDKVMSKDELLAYMDEEIKARQQTIGHIEEHIKSLSGQKDRHYEKQVIGWIEQEISSTYSHLKETKERLTDWRQLRVEAETWNYPQ